MLKKYALNRFNNSPIIVFDSGVGGLSILHEARKLLPAEDYIYYGDRKNAPYGERTSQEVSVLTTKAVSSLLSYHPKALVLACNSATAVVVDHLRGIFNFPVIGMEPAIKPAIKYSEGKKVLLIATEVTLLEDKLQRLIDRLQAKDQIVNLAVPELVRYAEEANFEKNKIQKFLVEKFREIDWSNYGSLVLGCTHYEYFKKDLTDYLPSSIQVYSGTSGTVSRLKSVIDLSSNQGTGSVLVYNSGEEISPSAISKFLTQLEYATSAA